MFGDCVCPYILVPPTVTWLLSPEEEGGVNAGQRGAATRRRAWTLLGLCWFVTVIPALEMEMWLPWGLANPCVMAGWVLRTTTRLSLNLLLPLLLLLRAC